jgi:hypothetical protein
MTLSDDNAFREVNLTGGSDKFYSGCAGNITALADGRFDTECARICKRNLNLTGRTGRSEDDNIRNSFFRSDQRQTLFAGKLAGLA